jgi:hypothetical protein
MKNQYNNNSFERKGKIMIIYSSTLVSRPFIVAINAVIAE